MSGRNGTQKHWTANCQHNYSKEASPNTKANTGNFTGMKCELIRTTIASYARQGHRTLLGKGLGAWISNAKFTSKGKGTPEQSCWCYTVYNSSSIMCLLMLPRSRCKCKCDMD